MYGCNSGNPAFAAENQKFTYTKIGDYNADNAVDISDVTALQLQLVGNEVITGAMLEHLVLTVTAVLCKRCVGNSEKDSRYRL